MFGGRNFGFPPLGGSEAGTTRTLTAERGTFTLGGQNVHQRLSRVSAAASFTYTGFGTTRRITMRGLRGIFTLTGIASQVFRAPPRIDYSKWRNRAAKLVKLRRRDPKLED